MACHAPLGLFVLFAIALAPMASAAPCVSQPMGQLAIRSSWILAPPRWKDMPPKSWRFFSNR